MEREYKISSGWKWLSLIVGMIFALMALYYFVALINAIGASRSLNSYPILLIVVGCALSAVVTLYRGIYERVKVTSHGIQYWTIGYVATVKWKNLVRVDNQMQGLYELEGVFVKYPPDEIRTWLGLPKVGFKKEKFIPLSMFSKNWRDSELGQQIKQYAPHLFN